MRGLALLLSTLLCLSPATGWAQPPVPPASDLAVPAWDLCTGPDRSQMACFTPDEVQQLLRIAEQARYRLELGALNTQIQTRMAAIFAEMEATQRSYAAIRDLLEGRVADLRDELSEARAEAERYRGRAERRRIWPWIALGFGVMLGSFLGFELAK